MWLCKFRCASECFMSNYMKVFLRSDWWKTKCVIDLINQDANFWIWIVDFLTLWPNDYCVPMWVCCEVWRKMWQLPQMLVWFRLKPIWLVTIALVLIRDQVHWEDGRVSASRNGQSGSSFGSYENTFNYSELFKASVDQSWFTIFLR